MKTTLKLVLAITVFALCSNVSAQNLKVAHINMQELVFSMPDYDSAMVKLQKFTQDLEQVLEEMQVELNKKQDDFQKNQANWSDLVKQSKNEDLVTLYQRIQTFQQQAQESYQQENDKLLQPVLEKANKAISAVANEQGITHVFSEQSLLFTATGTINLLSAVQKHLGITK